MANDNKHNPEDKLNEIVKLSKVKALVEFAKMHIDNSSSLLENHKKSLDELIKRNESTNATIKTSGKGTNSIALQEQKQKLKQIYPSLYPVLNEAQFALNEANLLAKEDIKSLINETIKANETAIAAIDSSIQVKDPSNTATETAISVNVTSSKANDVLNALNASFNDATKSNNEKMKNSIALAIKLGKMQANNTVVANPLVIITKDKNNKPDYKIYTKPAEIISQQTQANKNTNKTQLQLYKCMNGSFHKVRPVANVPAAKAAAAIESDQKHEVQKHEVDNNPLPFSNSNNNPFSNNYQTAANTGISPNETLQKKQLELNSKKVNSNTSHNYTLPRQSVANPISRNKAAIGFTGINPESKQGGGRRKTHRNKKSKSQRKRKHTRKQ